MAGNPSPERAAFEALASHEKLAPLVAITRALTSSAAEARRADWENAEKVKTLAEESKLESDAASTPFGNALDVLTRGPETASERALASALYGHVLAEEKLDSSADEERAAGDMLWLSVHTPFDATDLLDRALGEGAADMFAAIYARAERSLGKPREGHQEVLAAVSALLASKHEKAAQYADKLRAACTHSGIRAMLRRAEPEETARIEGEMTSAPRGPVVTTLLAITGIMFLKQVVRAFAKVALAYKRPTEATLTGQVIRIKTKTELLGRTLKEREYVITRQSLRRAVREVRYPRLAFYSGLFALALGSWFGVSIFVDGARAASPSLLGFGALVLAIGVGLEYVLVSLVPGRKKQCRVAFESDTSRLCIAGVDIKHADTALALLKGGA